MKSMKLNDDYHFVYAPKTGGYFANITFKYIFQRQRELFRGLKIDRADYDWKEHPVIHLNFGNCAAATYADFAAALPNVMNLALRGCEARRCYDYSS